MSRQMVEIVNLRLARKRKARAQKEQVAAENRAIKGRTKSQRESERRNASSALAFLDGHLRAHPSSDRE